MSIPSPAATMPSQPTSGVDPLSLQVNYHALLSNSPDTVVLLDIDSGRLLDINPNACILFGRSDTELLGMTLAQLCPALQSDGMPSLVLLGDHIARVMSGEILVFEVEFLHRDGRTISCELRMVIMPTPGRRLMHVRMLDITRRNMADQLRLGQGHLLEMIARGGPLKATLDELMLLIESQSAGVYCTVMLLDDDGVSLRPVSAPSLPPSYMAALDGFPIGPDVGSCGSAMFRKEPVIVSDIMNDPLWAPYKGLAEPYGLRACWSTPIFLDINQQVLGSFAMYYREVRAPGADDMRLIAVATHLAGIAIERTRRERELAQHREHLEELVAARTAALTLALETLSLTQEELVRRDKLAALGSLVAGVAHELNTPIGNSLVVATTMAEHAQALADDMAGGLRRSRLESYLESAREASDILVRNLQRAARLVASFKQLAVDRTTSPRGTFSLSELMDELALPLRIAIRARPITVELAVAPGLTMDSYPGALSQVISNLIENCLVHAFEGAAGGTITITAGAAGRAGVALDQDMVAISVSDDGAGIAPELAASVYDPFFTTKLGSGGSGLGLHVAHNIVSGILGGRIELQSKPGAGTTFTLLLPRVAPGSIAPP